jgi:hypothetical protein
LTLIFFVLASFLALLLIVWGVRTRSARRNDGHGADAIDTVTGWPPQATRVLTTTEREAYDLVRQALPAHMVLAQVPLQRFLKVPTRYSYAEWLRRVGQLSVDIVVCDRHAQVIAVIEVQAADEVLSHRAQRRRDRVLKVLKAAQIPVHVWTPPQLPSVEEVRKAIAPAMLEEAPVAVPATPSIPGRFATPAAASAPVLEPEDETGPLREPPPSTWFDDFDTAPAPLAGAAGQDPAHRKDRPTR